jgi:Uma2 family endonuclease
MTQLQTKIITDTWVKGSWEDYLQTIDKPEVNKAKCYYNQGLFRIEMSPLGYDHASDHSIINYAINLYASVKEIELNGLDNCTYRKNGYQDAQPDLSYYIGNQVNSIPFGTSIINLDQYPSPNLVIEIAHTSLSDDKGEKRILYEDLQIQEY